MTQVLVFEMSFSLSFTVKPVALKIPGNLQNKLKIEQELYTINKINVCML